ncbi:hypothetical protein L228DRAFT_58533 [Xylona heveae TC161]|uniref:Uncharacterized protein n=1 Tax=Xylona heveae (strain CBS 132557 / TC161) TaxID=1328760 RepID=A0A165IHY0_XYLHT|nr:hypothetical protein L228DRAFT_58533 [Xylona heveae TC161]KZF24924.1 hypothetical protein L228DRAFT_58533 [Xylona heveae TC161]
MASEFDFMNPAANEFANIKEENADSMRIKLEPEDDIPLLALPSPLISPSSSRGISSPGFGSEIRTEDEVSRRTRELAYQCYMASLEQMNSSIKREGEEDVFNTDTNIDTDVDSLFGFPLSPAPSSPWLRPEDVKQEPESAPESPIFEAPQPTFASPAPVAFEPIFDYAESVHEHAQPHLLRPEEIALLNAAIDFYPEHHWGRESAVHVDERIYEAQPETTTEVTDHAIVETTYEAVLTLRRTRKTKFNRQSRRTWINCRFRDANGNQQYYRRGRRVPVTQENPTPWNRQG